MNLNELPKEIAKAIIDNGMRKLFDNFNGIEYKIGSILEFRDGTIWYFALHKILYQLDKKKFTENRYPTMSNDKYILLDNIDYWITLKSKRDFIHVITYLSSIPINTQGDSARRYLKIVIYGPNRNKIREKIYKKIQENKPTEGKIRITSSGIVNEITTTTFNHVVLEDHVQRYLITSLYGWYKDKQWYVDHHLMHKVGILLYGEPGTGKSTLIRAISNMFGRVTVSMISADNIQNSIWDIHNTRSITNGLFIVVIEDIDLLCKSREEYPDLKNDYYYCDQKDKDQNVLFQLLDGIFTMEDTIFIATTNHKDRLDPALVRHGRFDIQIEMTAFDKPRAEKFIKLFGYDVDLLDKLEITYPIAPATLQAKVLEYKFNGGK